jgi:quercetin dioxygenase-like cupin family protein
MILKEIIEQLNTSTHPIAKALHKGQHFKVLAIGFKNGMVLKEHQTNLPTKLFVLQGAVIYKQNAVSTTLTLFDELDIPINCAHSVEAIADSICLLTQG